MPTPYPPIRDGYDQLPEPIVVSPAVYGEICCACRVTADGVAGVIRSSYNAATGGYDLFLEGVKIEMEPL